jgi:hypothetical protein
MIIWIGGVRFLVEFLRIGNWRLGDIPTAQLFGAAFVIIGIAIMVLRRRQGAPRLAPAEAGSTASAPERRADESGAVPAEPASAAPRIPDVQPPE